ncbi:hypothetical protein EVAR_78340_1 [Eumeta japonica]|uniref:Uncharacterized protein n=1 Tax=Eumeta variegata TaxID=151549 RepID=A0A4C1T6T8_EUMVA|nr:hypothetical protein EVAR_78340_1 [Eumeta japonica]
MLHLTLTNADAGLSARYEMRGLKTNSDTSKENSTTGILDYDLANSWSQRPLYHRILNLAATSKTCDRRYPMDGDRADGDIVLMEKEMASGPLELSFTGQNKKAEAATLRLYPVRVCAAVSAVCRSARASSGRHLRSAIAVGAISARAASFAKWAETKNFLLSLALAE